ncbi:MAG: polysaccharide biosynthesis/export family protein [Gemmobacter sp.]|nr:polysaccharide biosynthesis/export family protein [Gemmobacter sp.]
MQARFIPLLAVLLISACALPRGGAIQSEILAGSTKEDRDIEVVPVTRANVDRVAGWALPPQAVPKGAGWIQGGMRTPASTSIATGDLLSLTIWENDQNALLTPVAQKQVQISQIAVSSNGSIFVPYIGEVVVRGLSPEQARAKLQDQIDGVLNAAQVQLTVTQGRQNTVDLVGGVAKAGSYPLLDRSFSVLSLLSQGGGVSPALKNPQLKLLRGGKVHSISVGRLFSDPTLDTGLRGGDKIIVEDDPRYFLALGAAGTQSTIPFPQDHVSALDAVSLIGGVAATRADPGGVLILREYPAKMVRLDGKGPDRERVVFTLDLTNSDGLFSARNFSIQNGDLVFVTESPINSIRTVLGLVGQTFGLANQVNN